MNLIPNDTQLEILTHLDYETIISIAKTSKNLANIARNEFLWKRKLEEFKYSVPKDERQSCKQLYISKVRPLILMKKHIQGSSLLPHVLAFKYQKQYKKDYFFFPDEKLIILKNVSNIYLILYSSNIPLSPNGNYHLPLLSSNPIKVTTSSSYVKANINILDLLFEQSVINAPAKIVMMRSANNWYGGNPVVVSESSDKYTWYLTSFDDFMKFACS